MQCGKNAKRISNFNDWIKTKKLSFPEKKSFVNEKGLTVEYWVMKPANYEAGKKYPTILDIHGGPTAMWGPGESSMWHEFQYYCAKGYVVFMVIQEVPVDMVQNSYAPM
jgi:dipeptidyl aminopeptidase/acylaminoacyl peptidase